MKILLEYNIMISFALLTILGLVNKNYNFGFGVNLGLTILYVFLYLQPFK